jgi:hypothetical protein
MHKIYRRAFVLALALAALAAAAPTALAGNAGPGIP